MDQSAPPDYDEDDGSGFNHSAYPYADDADEEFITVGSKKEGGATSSEAQLSTTGERAKARRLQQNLGTNNVAGQFGALAAPDDDDI